VERAEWEDPVDIESPPIYPNAPIPLHERTWRHPSELGPTTPVALPPVAIHHVSRGVVLAAGLFGLACAIALSLMLLPNGSGPMTATPSSVSIASVTSLTLMNRAHGAWMGVQATGEGTGIRVQAVSAGSPAESAGLRQGDLIVRLGESPLGDLEELARVLANAAPGSRVMVEIERNGVTERLEVLLAPNPG